VFVVTDDAQRSHPLHSPYLAHFQSGTAQSATISPLNDPHSNSCTIQPNSTEEVVSCLLSSLHFEGLDHTIPFELTLNLLPIWKRSCVASRKPTD
jgi:hypothetical protein